MVLRRRGSVGTEEYGASVESEQKTTYLTRDTELRDRRWPCTRRVRESRRFNTICGCLSGGPNLRDPVVKYQSGLKFWTEVMKGRHTGTPPVKGRDPDKDPDTLSLQYKSSVPTHSEFSLMPTRTVDRMGVGCRQECRGREGSRGPETRPVGTKIR